METLNKQDEDSLFVIEWVKNIDTMSDLSGQDPTSRMKALSNAASDVKIDSRIPVRRYFRSGQEMIKMAEVYRTEGNLEASYVLYMKYMTLFVEKLKNHKDYAQILPAERKTQHGRQHGDDR